MIPYLQLLCIAGILYPIHMVNVQALVALGKTRLSFKLDAIKNGLRLVNIAIMSNFGVLHIIIGEVALSVISLAINTWFIHDLVGYGFWKQARDIWRIFLGGVLAGIIGYLPAFWYSDLWILLISGVVLTGAIFIGSQYLTNRKLFRETIQLKNHFRKT